ncbi:imidazole glycerol phosphate synthase subunit HisH [Lentisphaerota bacterium WC36G]|nr:imidazole glycerol phosphate synthase subunit HisH [Lentisphaerae bacterium WC36]
MIALIDYGMGNLMNVQKAVEFAGGDVKIVTTPEDILTADAVILPGVGNFGDGMKHLNELNLVDAIKEVVAQNKPFLGICLGMQMLLEASEEAPNVAGLGIIKGKVVHFPKYEEKVPHMGWNNVCYTQENDLLKNVADGSFFYFVHSYYAQLDNSDEMIGRCNYILEFPAIIGRGNIFAMQCHPEKSQDCGIQILENFVKKVNEKTK